MKRLLRLASFVLASLPVLVACSDTTRPKHSERVVVLVGDTAWNVDFSQASMSRSDVANVNAMKKGSKPTLIEGFSLEVAPYPDRTLISISSRSDPGTVRRLADASLQRRGGGEPWDSAGTFYAGRTPSEDSYMIVYDRHDPTLHFDTVRCQPNRLIGINNQDLGHPCRAYLQVGESALLLLQFHTDELTTDLVAQHFKTARAFLDDNQVHQPD